MANRADGVPGARPKAAATAHKQYAIPATCSSLPRLPFRDGSFAAVTMFHVVEHLPDPMAALEAAWHLLAPGGRLVVQVPNAACWQMLLLGERWSGLDIPRHLIDFRAEDLEELLEHAGFELGFQCQRYVNRHLVPVKVGVKPSTYQWV